MKRDIQAAFTTIPIADEADLLALTHAEAALRVEVRLNGYRRPMELACLRREW